jgi:methionyl-tRNA formyltransferase
VVEALELAACGGLSATPQPAEGVTYAHKIDKAEAAVDWSLPAATLERRIRAFDPFPGASSTLAGEVVKFWRARVVPRTGTPGVVVEAGDEGVTVACGEGALQITELQRAGGKRLNARQFLQGRPLEAGAAFGVPQD